MAMDCVCIPVRDIDVCVPLPDRGNRPQVYERGSADICIPVRDIDVCIPLPDRGNRPEACERGPVDICVPSSDWRDREKKPDVCKREKRTERKDIDLCKILERTQGETGPHKHNDFECHYQGEKRQVLINTLLMYLQDCDDRPVIKRRPDTNSNTTKGGDNCRPRFGPMIKYPGYVDYNHPYFSPPYNSMPDLATTNPCTPCPNPCTPCIPVCTGTTRGEDPRGPTCTTTPTTPRPAGGKDDGHSCMCAKRRGEEPLCPSAGPPQKPRAKGRTNYNPCTPSPYPPNSYPPNPCPPNQYPPNAYPQNSYPPNPCPPNQYPPNAYPPNQYPPNPCPPNGGVRYCCIPLPDC